jgi:hypothetical protein
MAVTYANAVGKLRERVRQTGTIALTEDQAIELLGLCQRYVNIAMQKYVTRINFTTSTSKLLYSLPTDLSVAMDIVSMYEGNRELLKCENLNDFAAYENNWFRNITGTRFEAWHQISRDYFIIYPAKASSSTVTIKYVVKTIIYDDYTTYSSQTLALPDEDVELVIKLAELIALIRSRQAGLIERILKQTIDLFGARNVTLKSTNP